MGEQIKELVFEANGNKYYIHKSLTVDRYKAFQKMQIEAGFGVGFASVYDGMVKAYSLLNKQAFADAAVLIHNMINSIKGLDEREHPAIVMCALFINREGENVNVVDDGVIMAKIEDWKAEGIPADFFFGYCQNLIQDYMRALKELEGGSLQEILQTLATSNPTKSE